MGSNFKILNVGCGSRIIPGMVNLDGYWNKKADLHFDLEHCDSIVQIEKENTFDQIIMTHTIEHIRNLLPLMQELHRIAKPDAMIFITCPHGASDDADEDPTHVRRLFPTSFMAFAQPYYWKADYGYRGDWAPTRIAMLIWPEAFANIPIETLAHRIMTKRNCVLELYASLRAIKPIRARNSPQDQPGVEILPQPEGYLGGPLP